MHLTLKFDLDNVDWDLAAEVYKKAGVTMPQSLREAFEQAKDVCLAMDVEALVGLSRLVDGKSGPEVRDLAMLPYAAGFDIGRTMVEYLARRAKADITLVPAGETERTLYKGLELGQFMAE